jgi:hypothetical protein
LTHSASPRFWVHYRALPDSVRRIADEKFRLLKSDPRHPSLHFKKIGRYWSCRVGIHYRALGLDAEDRVLWFWIGTHAEYDELLS